MRWLGIATATVSAMVLVTVAEGTAQQAPAKQGQQQDLSKGKLGPVVDTHEFMELFNEPLYESLSDTLGKKEAQVDWKTVEHDAYKTAEIANLIAIRERSSDEREWLQHSVDVQQAAIEVANAAKKKDLSAARQSFVTTVQHCNACHRSVAPTEAPTLKVTFAAEES